MPRYWIFAIIEEAQTHSIAALKLAQWTLAFPNTGIDLLHQTSKVVTQTHYSYVANYYV